MELLGDVGQVESHFNLFGDTVRIGAWLVIGLCQTYQGSDVVLDAPDGTPRYGAQVEARFGLFRDSANPDTR
jgi:hypothetical protein